MDRSCIIAEIGTSHGGDIVKAIEMIHAAHEAGADTAKFQWVYADEIIHPKTGIVSLPTGNIPLYERFQSLEKGPDFFGKLKEACTSIGIEFLCTPFGIRSALELWDLGVTRFKLASPELNHIPLLELLGATGAELIISSGVSRLSDIEEALEVISRGRSGSLPTLAAYDSASYQEVLKKSTPIKPQNFRANITLLHCMTAYPAPEEEYNLLLVATLQSIFGIATGISDHSLDAIMVPAISTILGGSIIEKHFTLSNDTDGLDDPIALNPQAFNNMVKAVRTIEKNSTSDIVPQSPEMASDYVLAKLHNANINADSAYISRIVGTGVKTLAPTEQENYGKTNRSLHARVTLKSGTILQPENIRIIRSEKILSPGIHPRYIVHVVGKKLRRDITDGEGIQWQDFIE